MAPPKNSLATAQLIPPFTELQSHCLYFDKSGKGILTIPNSYRTMRSIGLNIFLAAFGTLWVHAGFSMLTTRTGLPDPFLRIHVDRVHCAVHGSDSRVFDKLGRFNADRFEAIFDQWTKPPHDSISLFEVFYLILGDWSFLDFFGLFSVLLEWVGLWFLLGVRSPGGRMKKEDVRGIYDASTFARLEHKNPQGKIDSISSIGLIFCIIQLWVKILIYILRHINKSVRSLVFRLDGAEGLDLDSDEERELYEPEIQAEERMDEVGEDTVGYKMVAKEPEERVDI